jgi:hypothetical protein
VGPHYGHESVNFLVAADNLLDNGGELAISRLLFFVKQSVVVAVDAGIEDDDFRAIATP